MNIPVKNTLARLADAIEELPEETQAEDLAEFQNRIDRVSASGLTEAQRKIVLLRWSEPRLYASQAEMAALFRQYNPSV